MSRPKRYFTNPLINALANLRLNGPALAAALVVFALVAYLGNLAYNGLTRQAQDAKAAVDSWRNTEQLPAGVISDFPDNKAVVVTGVIDGDYGTGPWVWQTSKEYWTERELYTVQVCDNYNETYRDSNGRLQTRTKCRYRTETRVRYVEYSRVTSKTAPEFTVQNEGQARVLAGYEQRLKGGNQTYERNGDYSTEGAKIGSSVTLIGYVRGGKIAVEWFCLTANTNACFDAADTSGSLKVGAWIALIMVLFFGAAGAFIVYHGVDTYLDTY